jgi:hypothetical protein
MATERTAFRDLAVAAQAGDQAQGGDITRRLRIPSLEERALIYLRATKGREDFTNDEHVAAREIILDAMASEIASRAHPSASEGAGVASPSTRSDKVGANLSARLLSSVHRRPYPMEPVASLLDAFDPDEAPPPPFPRKMGTTEGALAEVAMARPYHRATAYGAPLQEPNAQAQIRSKLWTLLLAMLIAIVAGLSVLGAVTLVRMTVDWLRAEKPVTEASSSITRV